MGLQIYSTMSRAVEPLRCEVPGELRMYVCGMTVYDYCHIGHARVMVVFDMVARYLRWCGLNVIYVRNVTDIDDKIIRRANENGEDMHALTTRFIAAMHEDAARLGVLPPDHEPRATGHMDEIIALVERLIERGYAYCAANGDVYYRVDRFVGYGRLSGKKLDELRAGARVEVGEAKENPLDFVLWKAAKPEEPSWPSPWGDGRPGWHIECSAMSMACLGETFDLHGGGGDLVFPHHENEIAQSEAATGKKFAHGWMHVGYVQVNEEKMSKSLGNFFTIREVLEQYPAEVIRYFLLASHYRSPLNYSEDNLVSAWNALRRLYTGLQGIPVDADADMDEHWTARFRDAMDEDFNTPRAFAVLFELVAELNRARAAGNDGQATRLAATLQALAGVLGLLQDEPDAFLKATAGQQVDATEIETLIEARNAARAAKDFTEADRIRDELAGRGIELLDSRDGTSWRVG